MTDLSLYHELKTYYKDSWCLLLMKMDLLIHLDAARKDNCPLPECFDTYEAKKLPLYLNYVGTFAKPVMKEMFESRDLPYYANKYPSTAQEILSQQCQAAQYLNFTYSLPVFKDGLSNYMSVAEDCMIIEARMARFYDRTASILGDLLGDRRFVATSHSSATGGLLRALKETLKESNHALSSPI